MSDGVSLRILIERGVFGIGIDGTVVLTTLVEEVEFDDRAMPIFVTLATNEPVVRTLRLTSHGDIAGRFGLQIAAIIPVYGHIAYKLEGIIVLLIVLGEVGCHL